MFIFKSKVFEEILIEFLLSCNYLLFTLTVSCGLKGFFNLSSGCILLFMRFWGLTIKRLDIRYSLKREIQVTNIYIEIAFGFGLRCYLLIYLFSFFNESLEFSFRLRGLYWSKHLFLFIFIWSWKHSCSLKIFLTSNILLLVSLILELFKFHK